MRPLRTMALAGMSLIGAAAAAAAAALAPAATQPAPTLASGVRTRARHQEGKRYKGQNHYRIPVTHFDWHEHHKERSARPAWTYRSARRNAAREERKALARLKASGKTAI